MANRPNFFSWLNFAAVIIRLLMEMFDEPNQEDNKTS